MYHSSGCGCLTDTFISKANTNFTYLMRYAQCCHGDGSGETCVLRPYTLLKVTYVGISDIVIYCYHGDGSDGRHMCVSRPYAVLADY